jgi:hypothetical protein
MARGPIPGTRREHTSGQRSDIMAATVPSMYRWLLAPIRHGRTAPAMPFNCD